MSFLEERARNVHPHGTSLLTTVSPEAAQETAVEQPVSAGVAVAWRSLGDGLTSEVPENASDREFRLRAHALGEFSGAVREARETGDTANGSEAQLSVLNGLLRKYVTADGPTPQVRYRAPEGFDLRWVVNDDVVSFFVYEDAQVNVWRHDRSGDVVRDRDFATPSDLDIELGDEVRQALKQMGSEVRFPLVPFWKG